MAGTPASRGNWEVGKSAKKPRKEEGDPFAVYSASPAGQDPIFPRSIPGHGSSPDLAVPLRTGPNPADIGETPSPPLKKAANVTETARAFDQLQVRSAPHASLAASPSDSGADQPPSPKKRKAAGSLRQDSSTQRSGNDQEDTLASQSGPVGELLQEFGQIQLNKDFYDAIARTESCAGKAPLSSTRADVDRAAFEAAVGAATAVLRTQVKAMAEEGEEASPAFLQAYALNAISIFATQEESYSGEDLGSIEDPSSSSIDRPASAKTQPSIDNTKDNKNNIPGGARQIADTATVTMREAGPSAHPLDPEDSEDLDLLLDEREDDHIDEQIMSLEQSASAMALHSPTTNQWISPDPGPTPGSKTPTGSHLVSDASIGEALSDTAAMRDNEQGPQNKMHVAGRRRPRQSSVEGDSEAGNRDDNAAALAGPSGVAREREVIFGTNRPVQGALRAHPLREVAGVPQIAPPVRGEAGLVQPPGTPEGPGLEGPAAIPIPPPPVVEEWLPAVEEREQGEQGISGGLPSEIDRGDGGERGGTSSPAFQAQNQRGATDGENDAVPIASRSRGVLARGGLTAAIVGGSSRASPTSPQDNIIYINAAAAVHPQRPHAAAGHREKRDPRPLSSGDKSRLSNDPPKRQRKGPGFMVGSAPIELVIEHPFGATSPAGLDEAIPAMPAAVADSQGSVGGGGGGGGGQRHSTERRIPVATVAEKLRDDANSISSRSNSTSGSEDGRDLIRKRGSRGSGKPQIEEEEEEEVEGGSASKAPAAWGSSLVCADLTLHDVASQYWPAFKAAGTRQAGEMSIEEKVRVESLTVALGSAIAGAVRGTRSPSRRKMNAKVKSLAAASAFDELLKEREQMQMGKQMRVVVSAGEGSDNGTV